MTEQNETSASRAALLELRRERELIEQGHRFLDEKRMQLARELLRRIGEYDKLLEELNEAEALARQALIESVAAHGLADIQAHPSLTIDETRWEADELWFLGLSLPEVTLALQSGALSERPAVDRPALEETGKRYVPVVEISARCAAMLTSMMRLESEYKRTERSVRALENVVMPEIRQREKVTDEALAELEQEEAVRVRLFAPDTGAGLS